MTESFLVIRRCARQAVLITVLLTAASHARLHAQVPQRTLGPRAAEGSELFSQVRGFRELSDGRLLITDQIEKKIVLLDLDKRSATRVGKQGEGPAEYQSATDLFALPGDTTLLVDVPRGLNAFTIITPDIRLGAVTKLPDGVSVSYVNGVDRSGRLYFPAAVYGSGPSAPDSAPLLRIDRPRQKADTVLFLRVPRRVPGVPSNPYNPRDQWAVGPDGSIAVVNVDDYHVTWVRPDGKRTVGPRITYERIKVMQQDQDDFRALARRMQGIGVSGGGSTAGAAPPTLQSSGFPEYKPPFFGNDAVQIAPNGELWVRRSQSIAEKRPVHDIIDADGKRIATITLPADTKLLKLGARGIYLARWDQDDLIHIERYAYPR
jgi:hypothetical protein